MVSSRGVAIIPSADLLQNRERGDNSMRFSEVEMKRIIDKGFKNVSLEEEIAFNILNFIHCIYLNKQDFYRESFDSQYFGNLEMTFKKRGSCLIGHCRVVVKHFGRIEAIVTIRSIIVKIK